MPASLSSQSRAPFLQYESYAVLGAGLSGRAAARLLLDFGKNVTLLDDNLPEDAPVLDPLRDGGAVYFTGGEKLLPGDIEAVAVSPGYPEDHPLLAEARRLGLPVCGELELGAQCAGGARLVAITGTNGKTTVTSLITQILNEAGFEALAVGNIGYPICDAVADHRERLDKITLVAEVSSFQLETIDHFRPDAALVLNITPDHFDRHKTLEGYARVKQRITENQTFEQTLVINQDDPQCLAIARDASAFTMRFSLERAVENGAWLDDDLLMLERSGRKPQRVIAMDDLKLLGLHNVGNALSAICVCSALGVGRRQIGRTLKEFTAAPHRMETVASHRGVVYVNDSKATNLDAMAKAVACFTGGVHLIAGGRDKDSPFEMLTTELSTRVCRAYLIGEAAGVIATAWDGRIPLEQCVTMDRALEAASAQAAPGDVVLLAPGCASFDQFKSYVHRGESFASWVQARIEADPAPDFQPESGDEDEALV